MGRIALSESLEVLDPDGVGHEPAEFWAEQAVVLVLIRHFG